MTEEKKKFKTYIKNLIEDLIEANSGFILYKKLVQDAPKRFEIYNLVPTFFQLVIRSFYIRSVIMTCRFLDNGEESLSLKKMLCYAHANVKKIFTEEQKEEVLTEIEKDLKSIESFTGADRLKKHRDKRFAHLDKKFVDGKEEFGKRYPLENEDFEKCFDFIGEILNNYLRLLENGSYVFEYIGCDGELDVLLDDLEGFKKLQKDAFDGKIEGLSPENWETFEKYF